MSDVLDLMHNIQREIEGMRRGFSDFAVVSPHQIIASRHDALGTQQDKLATEIGEDAAALYVCTEYIRIMG